MTLNPVLKTEIKSGWDHGDRWGSTMGWWFAAADWLHFEGDGDVPESWGYKPGIGADDDRHEYQVIAYLVGYGQITDDDVRHLGNLMERLSVILKARGEDY